MPFGIGIWEIALLLLVALLVFGPKRLPEMGRSLGRGMREFKDSVTGKDRDDDDEEASLVEHLGELRARLLIAIGSIGVAFVVAFIFHEHLIEWLSRPLPPD